MRGERRERLEQAHRPDRATLPNGIVIRDQKPMPPTALARCLRDGTTPAEWYALLNAKVFLWPDAGRLARQAGTYAGLVPLAVLVVDTERLIARHAARIAVTPINTGNARRRAAPRGRATFVPYATWLESGWAAEAAALGTRPRPAGHPPAELVVADAVPDVMALVVEVRPLEPGRRRGRVPSPAPQAARTRSRRSAG